MSDFYVVYGGMDIEVYISKPGCGTHGGYTRILEDAKVWKTKKGAERWVESKYHLYAKDCSIVESTDENPLSEIRELRSPVGPFAVSSYCTNDCAPVCTCKNPKFRTSD